MDTILVAVISLALIIVSTLTITFSLFQSAHSLTDAWKNMDAKSTSIRETEISASAASYAGGLINISVVNEGMTNLYEYSKWDAIIQYQSGATSYLSYSETSPPGSGEWAIKGIYMDDMSPEVFDPNILNPEELMIIEINPDTVIGVGETARIVISTPNGVIAQCFVTR
jgi:hypothetical protein